jgi:indole-3-glycerol phosphate synthase
MTQPTETILDRIVANKREELAAAVAKTPLEELRARLQDAPALRDFAGALRMPGIALIAEVKKASPSRGVLREDFDHVAIARHYAEAGAAAISVLTDEVHFQGTLGHLQQVRQALPDGPPLLRKDFIFDEYQLYESRLSGADAVLFIVAILEPERLVDLLMEARTMGLAALVEVHDDNETTRAVDAGATIIGVNNRDLRTFEVDLATTERLRQGIPPERMVVAESGIFTREDVQRLEAKGVDAVLIGEALVTAPDPGAKIRELFG